MKGATQKRFFTIRAISQGIGPTFRARAFKAAGKIGAAGHQVAVIDSRDAFVDVLAKGAVCINIAVSLGACAAGKASFGVGAAHQVVAIVAAK